VASLPQFNSNDKDFQMMQNRWASILNPIINNPLSRGVFLSNITLTVGSNTINHKLSRKIQGYLVINMKNAYSEIYSSTSPNPELFLVLISSANTEVDLYVF
jgi:hypothetical protein